MIKLLDKTTIDKIAAGEVIERPSSVVKELLENSIDAGSTSITVEIKEGGLAFIRITDNGKGIPKDEVKTAYMRHATSKIESVNDLDTIASLGFRGEALSTIAAVSQTEMVTKTANDLVGVKYVIHGGNEMSFNEVGVPNGTTIIVNNLFFNTPARKKFLKSQMTEASYIQDLVLRLALSNPMIAIKLIVSGKTKISTSGNGNLKDVIYQLFGKEITNNLIKLDDTKGNIKISGYIGKPFLSRGNRGFENYFINGRYIKSNIINRAIEEAYKTYTMQHRFPFTVLFIELPQEKCDVNVHPTKMEFKYDDEKELFSAVTHAVLSALQSIELIPKDSYTKRPADKLSANVTVSESATPKSAPIMGTNTSSYEILKSLATNTVFKEEPAYKDKNQEPQPEKPIAETPKQNAQISLFSLEFLSVDARINHRVIGQLFDTYWLIEYDNSLYIMDQHAAHEKVYFEELMKSIDTKEVFSQQLLTPIIVTLSSIEMQLLSDNIEMFNKIGYDLEDFGGNEYKINAIPTNIFGIDPKDMFMNIITTLLNNAGNLTKDTFINKLATAACKAAIKGNTTISMLEAEELLNKLLTLDNPYTCPHGRPTIITMTKTELEKKFKRIV